MQFNAQIPSYLTQQPTVLESNIEPTSDSNMNVTNFPSTLTTTNPNAPTVLQTETGVIESKTMLSLSEYLSIPSSLDEDETEELEKELLSREEKRKRKLLHKQVTHDLIKRINMNRYQFPSKKQRLGFPLDPGTIKEAARQPETIKQIKAARLDEPTTVSSSNTPSATTLSDSIQVPPQPVNTLPTTGKPTLKTVPCKWGLN